MKQAESAQRRRGQKAAGIAMFSADSGAPTWIWSAGTTRKKLGLTQGRPVSIHLKLQPSILTPNQDAGRLAPQEIMLLLYCSVIWGGIHNFAHARPTKIYFFMFYSDSVSHLVAQAGLKLLALVSYQRLPHAGTIGNSHHTTLP